MIEDRSTFAEVVAALEDMPGRRNQRIGSLPARELRLLDDAVERGFGSAAEDREDRLLAELVDGVVPPLALGDLAAVDPENLVQLPAVEADDLFRRLSVGAGGEGDDARPAAVRLFFFHLAHVSSAVIVAVMIAPLAGHGKSRQSRDRHSTGFARTPPALVGIAGAWCYCRHFRPGLRGCFRAGGSGRGEMPVGTIGIFAFGISSDRADGAGEDARLSRRSSASRRSISASLPATTAILHPATVAASRWKRGAWEKTVGDLPGLVSIINNPITAGPTRGERMAAEPRPHRRLPRTQQARGRGPRRDIAMGAPCDSERPARFRQP